MNPFFFGASASQLFGAYDPPTGPSRSEGIVLCPPFGDEYFRAHASYRFLARQLSRAGFDVLRFDYFGTGDSAGEIEEANEAHWLQDIETAILELQDVAQVSRVSLVGLRYGAALAARVAQNRFDIDRLILWDPVYDGKAYLAELGAEARGDHVVEVHGAVLTAAMRRDMAGLNVDSFTGPLPRTLVTTTTAEAEKTNPLVEVLAAAGVDCDFQHVQDVAAWVESPLGSAVLPVNALRRIVEWLS